MIGTDVNVLSQERHPKSSQPQPVPCLPDLGRIGPDPSGSAWRTFRFLGGVPTRRLRAANRPELLKVLSENTSVVAAAPAQSMTLGRAALGCH